MTENVKVYNIERWDAVIIGNSSKPHPMVYIKPIQRGDLGDTDAVVQCKITGTGSIFDNQTIIGVVNNSGVYPKKRPIFYDKTGYYTITLNTDWFGYPSRLGKISVSQKGYNSVEELLQDAPDIPQPTPLSPMGWPTGTNTVGTGGGTDKILEIVPPVNDGFKGSAECRKTAEFASVEGFGEIPPDTNNVIKNSNDSGKIVGYIAIFFFIFLLLGLALWYRNYHKKMIFSSRSL